MAAPFVAGVAALVKARFPNLTPHQIEEQIEETGVEYETPQDYEWSRLDAFAALTRTPPPQ